MIVAPEEKGLRGSALTAKIKADPAWYCERVLHQKPWHKQVELIKKVFKSRRVEARGSVGSTKTFAAAMAVLCWLAAFPRNGRVFSLAPSFRQVDTNLWGYIQMLVRGAENAGTPLGCNPIKKMPYLEFGPGWYYKGFSTKDPTNVHGIHGENDLVILDDAHGLPKEITDELENMMAGGNTHLLMLYNPVVTSGETYDCNHADKDLWDHVKISYWDLVQARAKGHVLSGALQEHAVNTWHTKYGKTSSFCLSKVDAEYPKQAADTLLPMDWIERAMCREVPQTGKKFVGCDVAWTGDDDSIIAPMVGRQIGTLEEYHGQDPMQIADALDIHLIQEGVIGGVDSIGIGAGVYSREAQRGRQVHAINVAERAEGQWEGKEASEHFMNLRAQVAWTLREALDPANPEAIALPQDLEMQAQMSGIKYKINKQGKVQLQSKEDMKKTLGYSPDKFDAIAIAVWVSRGGSSVTQPWGAWV